MFFRANCLTNTLAPFLYIFLDIKLFLHASKSHGTDESVVCFLWWKRAVMFSETPGDTSITIWTTSIDGVGIIEIDTDSVGFFPVFEPTQELFTPIHTHISVNLSCSYELVLCCIPEWIFCSAMSQIIE